MRTARQSWPEEFATRYREAGYWTGETFGEMLHARALATPGAVAVVGGEVRWCYAELDARADAIAAGLLALGLRPGDRAVIHLPNIPEFLSIVFGMFRAGVLPVFALPAHRAAEIVHVATESEASAYVIGGNQPGFDPQSLAAEVLRRVPGIQHVIVAGSSARYTMLEAVERMGHDRPMARESIRGPRPRDVAFMQLSGGSTGLSKLIPRTHDDYLYSIRRSAEICGLDGSTVYLGTLPIAHNYAMSSPGTFGALYAGGTVALSPSPDPAVAFPIIEGERVTITGVVPPVALLWAEAARTSTHDLSSLRVLQVGGAKLLPELARRLQATFGATLQQVFGMAEGLVSYTRLDDPDDVIAETQGRPMCPDDEVLIVDGNDVPVRAGTVGHLLTRGPYTIRAYHASAEVNSRAFTEDGFYRTGDLVRQRPDGYLVVEGRATDRVNRGGEKVSADEVEDHLLAHPGVHDVVLIGIPDPYFGEKTCALVLPRDPAPTAVELRGWVRERGLAAFKVPDRIIFVDSFPTTGVGKISRIQLRAMLRSRLVDDPGTSTPATAPGTQPA